MIFVFLLIRYSVFVIVLISWLCDPIDTFYSIYWHSHLLLLCLFSILIFYACLFDISVLMMVFSMLLSVLLLFYTKLIHCPPVLHLFDTFLTLLLLYYYLSFDIAMILFSWYLLIQYFPDTCHFLLLILTNPFIMIVVRVPDLPALLSVEGIAVLLSHLILYLSDDLSYVRGILITSTVTIIRSFRILGIPILFAVTDTFYVAILLPVIYSLLFCWYLHCYYICPVLTFVVTIVFALIYHWSILPSLYQYLMSIMKYEEKIFEKILCLMKGNNQWKSVI